MVKTVERKEDECLQLNDELIKTMYTYVNGLLSFTYKNAIDTLKSRNWGYEADDFIQEVMQLLLDAFKTKSFANMGKLKNYIKSVVSFHYLKQKRMHFYTKQRGGFQKVSLSEPSMDYKLFEDIITYEDKSICSDKYDLHHLMQKNLFISVKNHTYKVGQLKDFSSDNSGQLLSVNQFIKIQNDYGLLETCKIYKNHGFYMTRKVFNELSQSIMNYAKDFDLLSFVETEYHRPVRKLVDIEFSNYVTKKCICGYENTEAEMLGTNFWQCPVCGRIHDVKSELDPQETKSSISKLNRSTNSYLETLQLH